MDTTTWTINDCTAAIIEGRPGIDRAIKERNARFAIALAAKEAAKTCTPKTCPHKHCTHGSEEVIQGSIDHAARLTEEAAAII